MFDSLGYDPSILAPSAQPVAPKRSPHFLTWAAIGVGGYGIVEGRPRLVALGFAALAFALWRAGAFNSPTVSGAAPTLSPKLVNGTSATAYPGSPSSFVLDPSALQKLLNAPTDPNYVAPPVDTTVYFS